MSIKYNWLIFAICLIICFNVCTSCDEKEKISGCNGYNHIYDEKIGLTFEPDSLYFFVAAASAYSKFVAPIAYELIPVSQDWLSDTLIITLHVYGESYDPDPSAEMELLWFSDTLVIWYSYYVYRDECDLFSASEMARTPPCPEPYYRIDYITITYPEDRYLVVHENVLLCH